MTSRTSLNLYPMGFGLMNYTWKPVQTSDEQAFSGIKKACDYARSNQRVLINSGEFYGTPERTLNLQLLNRFFKAYPEYRSKIFLSVKGALTTSMQSDCSATYLRESVENINKILGYKMDLFEPARVDLRVPVEEWVATLASLRDEGHFEHIGLSEVSAKTIRLAHSIAPIAAVEVEYSPWTVDIERNGVLATCKELGICIVSYSPLGRGFLTGDLKSPADIPAGDMRAHLDRFSAENFPKNLKLVDAFTKIAKAKGITNVQLALAWNLSKYESMIPIPGSTRVAGVEESFSAVEVVLTEAELKEIDDLVEASEVHGLRYNSHMQATLEL